MQKKMRCEKQNRRCEKLNWVRERERERESDIARGVVGWGEKA